MSKDPLKIYFNVNSREIFDQTQKPMVKSSTLPSIVLTEKALVNIQLIEDNNFTKYTNIPAGASADWITDNDYSNPQPCSHGLRLFT